MNSETPIYLTTEIRKIEQLAAALPNHSDLMEKAGLAAAKVALDKLLTNGRNKVLVLAGPGNNGGDAFIVARYLQKWWFKVTLVFTGTHDRLSSDARNSLDAWIAVGGKVLSKIPAKKNWNVVIDGLFGIGLERNLEGKYYELVKVINRMNLPVLALDIPSGLDSDKGDVRGAAIYAAMTVTFIGLKPGLLTHYGTEYCGKILLRNLDIDAPTLIKPNSWILDQACAQRLLPPPRPANNHKGMFGSVGIIGGSAGMGGAALLAGTAALKLGSGRVFLGLIADDTPRVNPAQPELMLRPAYELFKLDHLNCLVIGPGLGMSADAHFWLDCALKSTQSLVLDADALNLIAIHPKLANTLSIRKADTILTPHAAEAARMLGTGTTAIQNDRMAAVKNLVERFNCYAVLKGAGSICMLLNGKRYINTSGNPGLSSAGTGDVLSGIIGALLAQGLSVENALLLAVHLHGAAADELLEKIGGPLGMTASEITNTARSLLNQWIYSPEI
ncbi:MAG: NAD(P)H-hydrate dehydratase [Betaproteobacteria bacterium]|nr:MAG: NAD(P)H-hydrate dehydratase [Betaproteobacteria bacterium]